MKRTKRAAAPVEPPAPTVAGAAHDAGVALEVVAMVKRLGHELPNLFLSFPGKRPPCRLVRDGEGEHDAGTAAISELTAALGAIRKQYEARAEELLGLHVTTPSTGLSGAPAGVPAKLPSFRIAEERRPEWAES